METIKKRLIFGILSPTWLLADIKKFSFKGEKAKEHRTVYIKRYNWTYLIVSILTILSIFIIEKFFYNLIEIEGWLKTILLFVLGYYFLSRCNEIFIAFIIDAFDKVDAKIEKKTSLTYSERLQLAFRSYIELIFNFAILFSILPKEFWKNGKNFSSIVESIYFSGVTITTLGYGDITPVHWFSQFLSVYEVFCGFTLLVVCFAIYTNNSKNSTT